MRKNIEKVIAAWKRGEKAQGDSKRTCWTDGQSIFSYGTCLLTRYEGKLIFNGTSYSVTTSSQQRAVKSSASPDVEVYDAPRGCSVEKLISLGKV